MWLTIIAACLAGIMLMISPWGITVFPDDYDYPDDTHSGDDIGLHTATDSATTVDDYYANDRHSAIVHSGDHYYDTGDSYRVSY